LDPDPHQSDKLNPDPDPYQFADDESISAFFQEFEPLFGS
jgi:hypothetical protein